ncbi:DUF29 domain-containing protein [Pleurocapsa sp. PCC 7319]|uniref:DUF29 domain-containing protein n=1 Tax=Pleurocapsa sp. PCC 7319 TaxID=118161 RepID=UPI0003467010|nr:DUF29 domain-containing protein [Pleurocapsa sp. PCC 7319]
MTAKIQNLSQLYNRDYYLWLKETTQLLKTKNFSQLDIENLIEELETLGRSERNKIISSLRLIYQHLLKWQYQPEKRSKSWTNTIDRERDNICDYIEDMPSLKKMLDDSEIIAKGYSRGRRDAIKETGITNLPTDCPFTMQQVLDSNYLPSCDF